MPHRSTFSGSSQHVVGHLNFDNQYGNFLCFVLLTGSPHKQKLVSLKKLSDDIKGSALGAAASWRNGTFSLKRLAGQTVSLRVAMSDTKMYSIRVVCV